MQILKAISKYENDPSILRMKNYIRETISFVFVDKPKISNEINKLDRKKGMPRTWYSSKID